MADERTLEDMFSEFLRIYKFVNHDKILESLDTELGDDTKKKVYELSNGELSTRDIQEKTKVSRQTVSRYWKQWSVSGIVIPAAREGRYKAAFNLKEYGLSVLDDNEQGEEK